MRRLRAFFRIRTLQANTTAYAWVGKAAALLRGGAPIPTYVAPSWNNPLPAFTFVQGVPSTQSFAGYFFEGNGGTSTITGQNLPSGVTVDSAAKLLRYDGNGALDSKSVTLTADDGYEQFVPLTTLIVREPSGTAGMVFAESAVPSAWYVAADDAGVRAEVKNRWPDGSVKIAVLSWSGVTASSGSPKTLTIGKSPETPAGTAPTLARLRSTVAPTGTVDFGVYGTVNLATVIAGAPFRTWLSNTACSEWHWRSPVGADATLAVWFFVRLYANDRLWIRVVVENTSVGNKSAVVQQGKRYRAQINIGAYSYDSQLDADLSFPQTSVGGSTMWYWPWSAGDTLPHWSRSRWSKEFWYDNQTLQPVGHDGAYLATTKLLPHYGWSFRGSNGYTEKNTPLARGSLPADWGQGGYSPQIGYVPAWDAQYVAAPQGSAQQQSSYYSVVAHASLVSGMFFMRDETTHLLPLWTDYPDLYWSGPNAIGASSDGQPYRVDFAHQPSAGYVAYLLTGDYFHVETIQHMANWGWFGRSYSTGGGSARNGVDGVFWEYGGQVREIAWSLRTLGQALCVTPDASGLTGDATNDYHYSIAACYRNSLQKNIDKQLWACVDGGAVGSLGETPWPNTFGVVGTNPAWFNYGASAFGGTRSGEAPWQQGFCCVSLATTYNMKLLADQASFLRLVNHALKFPVALLGLGDANGWPYNFGGVYHLPFKDAGGLATDWTGVYTLFAQAWPGMPDQRTGLPATGATMFDTRPYDGGYGGQINGFVHGASEWAYSNWWELQPAISAAVDFGVTGAQTAYNRMKSLVGPLSGTFATYSATWNTAYPGFAVKPRNEPVTP